MRGITILALAILFTGCRSSSEPVTFAGPSAPATALDCATAQLQNLGYTVERNTGPGSASVIGTRIKRPPRLLTWIGFRDTANQITATSTGGQLQVTAISSDPGDLAEGGLSLEGTGANRQTERDARQVFGACSDD